MLQKEFPVIYFQTRFLSDLSATIVFTQVFALYCVVLVLVSNPTSFQWTHADPILKFTPMKVSIWVVILTSMALAGVALWRGHTKALLKNGPARQIIAGIVVAVVSTVVIRVIVGPSLPDFIPQEESAKPGFLLGMVAGYGEEVVFRMIMTPVFFYTFQKSLSSIQDDARRIWISMIASIVIVAFAFVIAHSLGDTSVTVPWSVFATRFLVPGIFMGFLYFYIGPGFVIFMHSTAHIMIPFLFD